MIMCSKCKKRPAVVFISSMPDNKNRGLCLACAQEENIPQISEYLNQLGVTKDEIENLSDQMMNMLDGDSFEMGGSGLIPDFMSNMFGFDGSKPQAESTGSKEQSDSKPEKKGLFNNKREKKPKELKFLGNYCTNLSQHYRT